MQRIQLKSYDKIEETTDEQIKTEKLRRLKIENDLRIWYGKGGIIALFMIIGGVLALAFFSGAGLLSLPAAAPWISVIPLSAFVGLLCAIARRLFNRSE